MKRRGDRFALMRDIPGVQVTRLTPKPKRIKGADPEAILQGQVNECIDKGGMYQFRISEHVLAHGDSTVGGWPDSPIIMKVVPGMSLIFPLELKKRGQVLRPNQLDMQEQIGTVMADNWEDAWDFIRWAREMHDLVCKWARNNPMPKLGKAA
jgi:hypothetical protein